LPCRPLDLLVALHTIVAQSMGSEPARARSAATAAWAVVDRTPDDPLLRAQAHWSQASAVLYRPDYVAALDNYDRALECYDQACRLAAPQRPERDVPIVHVVRIFCLSELGRYREAQQAAELAECWLHKHPNDVAALKLLLNRSQLAFRMGDNAQVLALADATITRARACGDYVTEAQAQNNRALACIMLGQFAEAEQALADSAATASAANETLTVWRVQLNRALLCRFRGQLFEALTLLRTAEQELGQVPNEAAVIAWDEAAIYEQLRQLPDAQAAAQRAAGLFAQQSMAAYSASAALQGVYIAVEQHAETLARSMLAQAREQARQSEIPIVHAEIALAEALLATLPVRGSQKVARQRRRSARTSAEQSVAVLEAGGLRHAAIAGQFVVATLAAQLGDSAGAQVIYRQFLAHANPGVRLTANAELGALAPPGDALEYLQGAATLAVAQRRALPMEELQARYSSETSPHHLRLAAWYLEHGDVARAFESICIAKAGPLLDLRAIGAALDTAAQTRIETAKATLAHWRRQQQEHERATAYAQAQSRPEQYELSQRLAEEAAAQACASEQHLTNLMRTLGDRSGQADAPDSATIQRALPPGTVLLEYAQRDDQVICFLIQPDRPIVYRELGSYQELFSMLDHWHLLLWGLRRTAPAAGAAHQRMRTTLAPLREKLLGPWRDVLDTSSHVLVAPWGVLHQVPWAALLGGIDGLGDAAQLTLTPSGGLWGAPYEPSSGAIGPPRVLAFEGTDKLRLAHVATEVAAICKLLPDAICTTQARAADLQSLPPPRLLHIAAHGATNSAAPLYSTLELADGPFLLLQAHRLNLRGTQLVALSACETGARPDYGDMVLALAGAFLCAGARAVLASLWEVDDAATATLMQHFYAALASGRAPSAALREAQIAVREAHPLDWPAFQLWAGTQTNNRA
jgi:CHAT domain-containing protein